jgi:hypothetical protein
MNKKKWCKAPIKLESPCLEAGYECENCEHFYKNINKIDYWLIFGWTVIILGILTSIILLYYAK